jgi:hypothetical protein
LGSNSLLAHAKRKDALRILIARALIVGASLYLCSPPTVIADTANPATAFKLLPDHVGNFKATEPAIGVIDDVIPQIFGGHVARNYTDDIGARYEVELKVAGTDSQAFALLTRARWLVSGSKSLEFGDVGTASVASNLGVFFFRGTTFVLVHPRERASQDQVVVLARSLAQTLDAGDGDIPVLVKHLPDWQNASHLANYFVSLGGLEEAIHLPINQPIALDINKEVKQPLRALPQPVFGALNFDGGTEAVADNYGQSQLVIVEFTTPQFASDNDRRITAKIQELKNQGQPTPTGYRRVGNYSVFVFNAPDEKTANQLIDQVKYEQVVQWLGDDPHLYERVQRYVLQKTGGVVIAVLESSGLSVLLCLGVGGLFGALLFRRRRRARLRQGEAYSDAGGMVRLNLDEVVESDAARLLQGRPRKHD